MPEVNEELLQIRDLLKVDREMDALKDEAGALASAINDLRAKLAEREAEREALLARLAEVKTEERKLNRRLEDYSQKRDRTRILMDEGKAPDFLAAQRQLEQVTEIADQTETALLEQMEGREALEAEIAALDGLLERTRTRIEEARSREASRRPEIAARYSELKTEREQRWQQVSPHHRTRYQTLRTKKLPVVVDIVNGTCPACHIEPPPQAVLDVARGSRQVQTCRGCGCFFFDVRDTTEEEEAD